MLQVVNFSGGAGSAVALFRVVERFGVGGVRAVFADTGWESQDVYDFVRAVGVASGVAVEWLGGGRTIWDVFIEKGAITNRESGGCLASLELKRAALEEWRRGLGVPCVVHVGFGPDEEDRAERLRRRLPGVEFDFPLWWEPRAWRCDVLGELGRRGLVVPVAYERGYQHANCGGGCVLAGVRQWVGLLADDRERFLASEGLEAELAARAVAKGLRPRWILRDRRGGVTVGYPLSRLRADVEAGRRVPDDSWRVAACSCGEGV